jgi:hypothetical protein
MTTATTEKGLGADLATNPLLPRCALANANGIWLADLDANEVSGANFNEEGQKRLSR